MKTVQLLGITRHGKNKISENGNIWKVLKEKIKVQFSPISGPWLLIESLDTKRTLRWIHKTKDINFKLLKEVPCKLSVDQSTAK